MEAILQERKLTLRECLVALLCFSGAGVGSFKLYTDFAVEERGGQGTPMATIERVRSAVRRRAASSYLWTSVDAGSELYRRDSIQAGEESTATLRLKDGRMLELGENSLVVIDELSQLSLNFLRGTFVLRSNQGDSLVQVQKDGKTTTRRLPLRLLVPERNARYFLPEGETASVNFQWKSTDEKAGFKPVEITVATAPSFPAGSVRNPVEGTTFAATLGPGSYFWHLSAGDDSQTETRQFHFYTAPSLQTLAPAKNEKIETRFDTATVRFRWIVPRNTGPRAERDEPIALAGVPHTVVITLDPEGKNVVLRHHASLFSGTARIADLPVGHYYWKLSGEYASFVMESDLKEFTVEKKPLLAVSLENPSDGEAIESAPQFRFQWQFEAPASQFVFELEQQSGEGKTASTFARSLRVETTLPLFDWKQSEAGNFRWRITALQQKEIVGSSPWQSFSVSDGRPISLVQPATDASIYHWKTAPNFVFAWLSPSTKLKASLHYLLEIATDAALSNEVVQRQSEDNHFNGEAMNLSDGDHYWRVRAVDAAGKTIRSSPVGRFRYQTHATLPSPVVAEPTSGALFRLTGPRSAPVLRWKTVESAAAYEVRIDSEGALFRQETTKDLTLVLNGIKTGKYVWTVAPIDPLGRVGAASPAQELTVAYSGRLPAPKFQVKKPIVAKGRNLNKRSK